MSYKKLMMGVLFIGLLFPILCFGADNDPLLDGDVTEIVSPNAATYDVVSTASIVIVNCTYTDTGAITSLTLDTDICVSGKIVHIKDADFNASTNTITIDTEGAETIDEQNTYVIDYNGQSISLYSDGSNWFSY